MEEACRCQTATHGHEPGACPNAPTEVDGLCKPCHDDKAAAEGMGWFMALSEPLRPFFSGSRGMTKTREYYETHRVEFIVGAMLTVAASVAGLFVAGWPGVLVGLIIGLPALFLNARVKIREIERGL
jgi:hypothetical protein